MILMTSVVEAAVITDDEVVAIAALFCVAVFVRAFAANGARVEDANRDSN